MARLESPDPVAEFRRRFGNPIDPKDTFEVLVRENWLRYGRKKNFLFSIVADTIDAQAFSEKRSMRLNLAHRIATPQSESYSTTTRQMYRRYVENGRPDLAADNVDRLFPLLRLYVLADQLCDFTTANLIMNDIVRASDEFKHTPSKEEILFVWSMIDSCDHPLRMLFVDYQIHEADDENLLFEDPDDNLSEYLKDVAWGYADLAQRRGKLGKVGRADDIFMVECSSRPYCYYHQHDKDQYHVSCQELGLLGGAERSGAGNGE